MRLKVQITVLFTLGLVTMALAQDNTASFFEKLAQKDAQLEQSVSFSNLEDEKDYWNDQIRYEKDLKELDVRSYNVYMNEKRIAYSKHAEACNNHCKHSDYYYQQAGFYFIYKDTENYTKGATDGIVQVASPRIF